MPPTRESAVWMSAGTAQPRRWMRPAVGCASPSIMRISVVLPQPFGPSQAKQRPRGTSIVTSSTARICPNRFETCSSWMIASLTGLPAPRRRPRSPMTAVTVEHRASERGSRHGATRPRAAPEGLARLAGQEVADLGQQLFLRGRCRAVDLGLADARHDRVDRLDDDEEHRGRRQREGDDVVDELAVLERAAVDRERLATEVDAPD